MHPGAERVPHKAAWQACSAAGAAPLIWLLAAAAFQAALPVCGLLAMQALADSRALGVSGALTTDGAWVAALQATGVAGAVAFTGAALRSV
ncbi:MAG: hypothetical protein VYA51_06290, partial [Planctomycetota bacterium]|nr:hypothetical protein [Planctomycetota bacterium]